MSFQPTLPLSGLGGWSLLTKTRARQEASFSEAAQQKNLVSRFDRDFPKITSVEKLLSNRPVLQVVLGAFGLEDDLANRGFIKRVITDGTENPAALSNRLTDKRYFALAQAVQHLTSSESKGPSPDLGDRIKRNFLARSFEVAVGRSNPDFRLAMAFERELSTVLSNFSSDRARWFAVLGNPPLRKVLETAVNLPRQISSMPLEQQVRTLQTALDRNFGVASVAQLTSENIREKIIERFIIRSEVSQQASTPSPLLVLFGRL